MSRDHALTQRLEALEAAAFETEGRLRFLEARLGLTKVEVGGVGGRAATRDAKGLEASCNIAGCLCGDPVDIWYSVEAFPAFEEDATLPDSEDVARDATPWSGL